jgi:hypothetical protein
MSRTFFAALALISLAACGGAKKPATHTAKTSAAAPQTRAPAAKPKARQTTARRDTVTQRNPMGH